MIRSNIASAGGQALGTGEYVCIGNNQPGKGDTLVNNTYESPATNYGCAIIGIEGYSTISMVETTSMELIAFNDISDATVLTPSLTAIDISGFDYILIHTEGNRVFTFA